MPLGIIGAPKTQIGIIGTPEEEQEEIDEEVKPKKKKDPA